MSRFLISGLVVIIVVCISFFGGCGHSCFVQDSASRVVVEAKYTDKAIVVDGVLDDAVWKQASVYELSLSSDKVANGGVLKESGSVRFAWDDEYFYVGACFTDSDIVAEGKKDQMHHYKLGDLCELFIKPQQHDWYWELYATPLGKKTSFLFPSKGRAGLPSCFEDYISGLIVAVQCNGTVNNWHDRDKKWTAEMALPVKDLNQYGAKFKPGQPWRIFVGRYNYSVHLKKPELSMMPMLSATSYHLLDEYADLELIR